ncbi:MAG: hypothetical protein WC119_01330 [Synergistaceae bacterium]
MGLGLFGSSSSYDRKCNCGCNCIPTVSDSKIDKRNPDPYKWEVIRSSQIGQFLLVQLKYPNCTNYEGEKIMVYKNVVLTELVSQKTIDPHFSNNKKYHSPIARFLPTDEGWRMAQDFVDSQLNLKGYDE